MAYWGAHTANLAETAEPLIHFLQRLKEEGEKTARQMYGVSTGWVAHGFTDIWMDTGLLGDLKVRCLFIVLSC